MPSPKFNLIDDPWIQVLDNQYHTKEISLLELFQHPTNYKQLAGEMPSQDVSILRLILSIMFTVYSRYDQNGQPYDWIDINPKNMEPNYNSDEIDDINEDYQENNDVLFNTWTSLYQSKKFNQSIIDYLKVHHDEFNFFDDIKPFFQVNQTTYNKLVPNNRQTNYKHYLTIRQINRTISESNNTTEIFSSRSGHYKDDIQLTEFIRWIINYQNFTGVTDKTKLKSVTQQKTSISTSRGWTYSITPTYMWGSNLFDTLMLNFNLQATEQTNMIQQPVWEWTIDDYINCRAHQVMPDNIAELYTLWSRMLYINWNDGEPLISVAGLPAPDSSNSLIEPMTTWHYNQPSKKDKKEHKDGIKTQEYQPVRHTVTQARQQIWRHFEDYIQDTNANTKAPDTILWIQNLKKQSILPENYPLHIKQTGLAAKPNAATSQLPVYEFNHDLQIQTDVLFDESKAKDDKNIWPNRIKDIVEITNNIVQKYYFYFIKNSIMLTGLDNQTAQDYTHRQINQFYQTLNRPFNHWLANLNTTEDRDIQCQKWKDELAKLAYQFGQQHLNMASPAEIRGRQINGQLKTVFQYYRRYKITINKVLNQYSTKERTEQSDND